MSLGRIILSSLLILSLCACGNGYDGISGNDLSLTSSTFSNEETEDLKNTINDTMMALKNLDMDKFNAYTNNRQIMVTPWGTENVEYTLFGELSDEQEVASDKELAYQLDNEIVKNLSWEILDVAQDNDTAKIRLRITNLNMDGIFQRVETDSEMIKEIRKIPLSDTKTVELKLKAEKQNEKWILLIDIDFVDAISANIWSVDTAEYLNGNQTYDNTGNNDFVSQIIGNSITYDGVASASKEQKIEIVSAVDNTITQITDLHEITEFLKQEEMYNWIIVENIPEDSKPILSIVRYALERKNLNPQLKEQSRDLLYQAEDVYYIEDRSEYLYTDMPNYELPRYYEIPSNVGKYLKQFLQ
uniref:hypothetical protein n=1 Tax=Enterocloster clostridioformis TaxID=1531 RepID=UPI0026EC7F08|nr:hypothetical protein [Enterocloster clostridioformis]